MKAPIYTALSSKFWDKLAMTPPGAGDEIQLTDTIDMLMAEEAVEAFHMTGKSHDCGDKLGYMKAFVEYGLRHHSLGHEFKKYLVELHHEQADVMAVAE